MEGVEAYGFSAAMSGAFLVSSLLFAAFNRRLREPYMDEVFHVPQAQAYCHGSFLQVPRLPPHPRARLLPEPCPVVAAGGAREGGGTRGQP